MDRQKRSTQTRFACWSEVRTPDLGGTSTTKDLGTAIALQVANRILHFLCWPFFQRIMVSIGTKSAVLPFRRQNAEAVVTKRSKPRPFRFPVSRGTVWIESPPVARTWPRTITTNPESRDY